MAGKLAQKIIFTFARCIIGGIIGLLFFGILGMIIGAVLGLTSWPLIASIALFIAKNPGFLTFGLSNPASEVGQAPRFKLRRREGGRLSKDSKPKDVSPNKEEKTK